MWGIHIFLAVACRHLGLFAHVFWEIAALLFVVPCVKDVVFPAAFLFSAIVFFGCFV